MNNYYTYIYLDPRKPGNYTYKDLLFEYEPFYIGKGKGRRFERSYKDAISNRGNKYRHNKIRSIYSKGLKPIIIKVFDNITEAEAFSREIELIEAFKSFLCNLTSGGDGISGHKKSEDSKIKCSISNKKIWTEAKKKEFSERMKTIIKPEDVRRRVELRKQRGNYKKSEIEKAKMKESSKALWQDPAYRIKVMSNRAKALSEGRGKRKSQYTKEELKERANINKRNRRAERRNKT